MKKYVSEYTNGKYQIGCTGNTIIVKQTESKGEFDRIKFPYGYFGTFVPDQDIFIAKSTAGYLLKYNLPTKETKKIHISGMTQDGGFAICPWKKQFYNIEMNTNGFQIAVYDIESFQLDTTIPIKGEVANVYDIEFESNPIWYISFSYSNIGRVKKAIVKMRGYDSAEIREINPDSFNHAVGYKYWERCGFTDKSFLVSQMFSSKCKIPISLSELFNKSER